MTIVYFLGGRSFALGKSSVHHFRQRDAIDYSCKNERVLRRIGPRFKLPLFSWIIIFVERISIAGHLCQIHLCPLTFCLLPPLAFFFPPGLKCSLSLIIT